MKKTYVSPEATVVLLELSDIIVASAPTTDAENKLPDDELDFEMPIGW